jgi:hypothetical protein
MKERWYDRTVKLMISVTKNLADLYDLSKEPIEDDLTEEEKKQLLLYKIKLSYVVSRFKEIR